jgi:tRNA nucleotidyltransferase (CCA-adding enzyme)
MAREHVDHADIARFAAERVNLPRDEAEQYRAQVRGLRERLEGYLTEHPDFSLKKMMLSGSLAKGTALRALNDIDVACYVAGADAPKDTQALLEYLAARLRKAYPNFKAEQVKPQQYSVTVSFMGSGLDVDVVPILYDGDPQWFGNLVSQDDGSLLKTNIPFHLEFIRKRKNAQPDDFAQMARLIKYWIRYVKQRQDSFRFKSFMVELILAHIADAGVGFTDFPEALQHFFTYIIKTDLRKRIVFPDYYSATAVGNFSDRIQIIDPVNAENNAARLYNDQQAAAIVEAAMDAGDAIDSALRATTKADTVRYWQKVFGPTFQV